MASKLPNSWAIHEIAACGVARGRMHIGTTYTSPSSLKMSDFPSMTGSPALGPIFPYPSTAVPSVTMADKWEVLE
jgi:hypothetical protein